MPHISGFHRLTLDERRQSLRSLDPENTLDRLLDEAQPTPNDAFDRMSENVIGTFRLPLSILTSVCVNDVPRPVAMVTEEPSVVAAANAATALFERCGGVHTQFLKPTTSAQIVLSAQDPMLAFDVCARLECRQKQWLDFANQADPGLIAAGGGAFGLSFECLHQAGFEKTFIVGKLDVHTVDIMGANAVNTMAEAVLSAIMNDIAQTMPTADIERVMAILTNAAPGRLVHANVQLPFDQLNGYRKAVPGNVLAHKVELASQFALASPQRAVTHNKGILNGIFAAALPLGQDIRAISASTLDYACQSGVHRPLSCWKIDHDQLVGDLTLPIVAGTVGGSRHALPTIDAAFRFAAINSYEDLCGVLSAIGLAQNFAALAALVTDGIQEGHLKLHQRKRQPDAALKK